MVPKTNQPKVNILRPISLNNIGYKVMSVTRKIIGGNIEKHEMGKSNQVRFPERNRIYNFCISKYCIENKIKKTLVVSSYFQEYKAFDNINRCKQIVDRKLD